MSTIDRRSRWVPRTINHPVTRSGIFGSCSPRDLAAVQLHSDVVELDAGTTVQALQPLRWVYVIFSGLLAASGTDNVFVAGPGSAIGVRSALDSRSPDVSLTAVSDATVLVTTAREFTGLVRSLEGLAIGVARHLETEPALL